VCARARLYVVEFNIFWSHSTALSPQSPSLSLFPCVRLCFSPATNLEVIFYHSVMYNGYTHTGTHKRTHTQTLTYNEELFFTSAPPISTLLCCCCCCCCHSNPQYYYYFLHCTCLFFIVFCFLNLFWRASYAEANRVLHQKLSSTDKRTC